MQRLVDESRVTRVTFYRHFPSKDNLVLAYLERVTTRSFDIDLLNLSNGRGCPLLRASDRTRLSNQVGMSPPSMRMSAR